MKCLKSFENACGGVFERRYFLFRWLFVIAIILILSMSFISSTSLRIHPDEFNHIAAARFYIDNWLPPAVADPRTMDSYHNEYGVSYHNEWDIVYLLAGKFAILINPFVANETYALRLFNVGLFIALACIASFKRCEILTFAVLLTSPQIWYVFSYFNGDAFPMFLSLLVAYEITSVQSLYHARSRRPILRFLPLGFYIGLIILSKKTFWAFGLFAVGCVAWFEFYHYAHGRASVWAKHMVLLGAIICISVAPRIFYDFHLNGMPGQKAAKVVETAEILADVSLKPSLRTSSASAKSAALKDKGVSLIELFDTWHWGKKSLLSAFGVYQYMSDYAEPKVYMALFIIYEAFLIYLIFVYLKSSDIQGKLLLGWSLSSSFLIIGLSLYNSWDFHFQAQGRYLFGIFCILSVLLAYAKNWLNTIAINLLVGALFTISAYSFVFYGLKHIPKGLLFERILGMF